jgi:AcrR family transcriptional regulator
MQNAILTTDGSASDDADTGPDDEADVAVRIARRTLAARGPDYPTEVRRLLDAALGVMRTCGTASRPRVADIVAAAGLSNDAFYRHFASKDALAAALLEDGAQRLKSYVGHQMAKETTPQARVRRWVEGILSQADDDEIAATTLAVMWNAGGIGVAVDAQRPSAVVPLAELAREPFADLGSVDPELDARLAAHAVVGVLSDHLWQRSRPSPETVDRLVAFCVGGVTARTDQP